MTLGQQDQKQLNIAVVGTGIAGLSAAWLLGKQHRVTVYEQNTYAGGHSNTAEISLNGRNIAVDTGFIVYNPVNYPNLVALFEHLQVPNKLSDMSFAASLRDGSLEYSGTDLNGLFAQRSNLARPRFYSMLKDLMRFYRQAPDLACDSSLAKIPLGDFLRREAYGDAFIKDHLMPMGAAIWSSSVEQMLTFPTLSFLRFFKNHGLVQLSNRPEWRTVDGGSREYVRRILDDFSGQVHYGDPVTDIVRKNGRIKLATQSGLFQEYDHVVMACHSDEALKILNQPSDAETQTLGQIRYQNNEAILHTDTRLMPARRRAWASWNYIGSRTDQDAELLCVTYWMNLLQSLSVEDPVLVTLNPCRQVEASKIIERYDYAHPIFDAAAINAQPELWQLQGQQNTWFCGAYFGYGFHEDGIQSGLGVAELLGGMRRPWAISEDSDRVNYLTYGQQPETGDMEPERAA